MGIIYISIAVGTFALWYLLCRFFYLFEQSGADLAAIPRIVEETGESVVANPFFLGGEDVMGIAFMVALLAAAICLISAETFYQNNLGAKHRGREYGSAHWLAEGKRRKYRAKRFEENFLLSEHFLLNRNKVKLARFRGVKRDPNRHVKVMGGSGSWKSSAVLDPNILQYTASTNASFVCGDPKNTAVKRHIRHLLQDGYKVKFVNLIEMALSMRINVFSMIRATSDIPIVANMIIDNTTPPDEHKDFWTRAEHGLYLACIGWLHFFADEETKNLPGLIDIVMLADASEEDENSVSPLDILIEDVEANCSPDDDEYYVVRCYDFFKKSAGKTAKSILSSCGIRLAPFNIPEVRELTSTDELDLGRIGEEKTAFFVGFSATDKTYSFLVAFVFMLFSELVATAAQHGSRLPVPVTMFLDEFAQYGVVKDIEVMIAFLRGYGVNLWLFLQADSQLDDVYNEHRAKTITGNCDTTLFLGSVDYDTCEKFSKELGNETIVVETDSRTRGSMPGYTRNWNKKERPLMSPEELGNDMLAGNECIVKIKQEAPYKDTKTNVFKHPRHKDMDDDDGCDAHGVPFDFAAYLETYRTALKAERFKREQAARGIELPRDDTSFESMFEGVSAVISIE